MFHYNELQKILKSAKFFRALSSIKKKNMLINYHYFCFNFCFITTNYKKFQNLLKFFGHSPPLKKYKLINYRYFCFNFCFITTNYKKFQNLLKFFGHCPLLKNYTLIYYRYFCFNFCFIANFLNSKKKNYKKFTKIVKFFRALSLSGKSWVWWLLEFRRLLYFSFFFFAVS